MATILSIGNSYISPSSANYMDIGSSSFSFRNLLLGSGVVAQFGVLTNVTISNSSSTVSLTTSGMYASSARFGVLIIESVNLTKITCSSLIIQNNSNATLNGYILQDTANNALEGDVWFKSSSNQMYLFIRSNNINFYVAMGTTNAYPAL